MMNNSKLNLCKISYQFPPSIIISEQITNGSFTYSGTSLDIIDYVAEALNIR